MNNIRYNEPMNKHTSFRVGGIADIFYTPDDLADLVNFFKSSANKIAANNLYWLGLGSNILVRDGGIKGTVIATANKLARLELTKDNYIYAQAGVSCAKLSRFSTKANFSGLEFLSGIPGTIGGALAMNAGAFGSETWQQVKSVTTINLQGELQQRTADDYAITYRSVRPKFTEPTWFVAAEFSPSNNNTYNIKSLLNQRNQSQPIGLASCGSVFKNPFNHHAAQLIEAAGLKGFCIGKACVANKHANFIINNGGATATEIENLICHIQTEVYQKFNIQLEPEVKIIGQNLMNNSYDN